MVVVRGIVMASARKIPSASKTVGIALTPEFVSVANAWQGQRQCAGVLLPARARKGKEAVEPVPGP